MWKLIAISTLQCLFLVSTQIFLKFAVVRMGSFSLSWEYLKNLLSNWQFACSGICIAIASLLWMYILKYYPFSMAYPMISISYVFGMLASVYIFHEAVPFSRWIGIAFIIAGVIFVARH